MISQVLLAKRDVQPASHLQSLPFRAILELLTEADCVYRLEIFLASFGVLASLDHAIGFFFDLVGLVYISRLRAGVCHSWSCFLLWLLPCRGCGATRASAIHLLGLVNRALQLFRRHLAEGLGRKSHHLWGHVGHPCTHLFQLKVIHTRHESLCGVQLPL